MENKNFIKSFWALIALFFVSFFFGCATEDNDPVTILPDPAKDQRVEISYQATENPQGSTGSATATATIDCYIMVEENGVRKLVKSTDSRDFAVNAALTFAPAEVWLKDDISGSSSVSTKELGNINGIKTSRATFDLGKDKDGNTINIFADFSFESELYKTCLGADSLLSFGFEKAELMPGFENVKIYDTKVKGKDGKMYTQVDRKFRVRFHSNRPFINENGQRTKYYMEIAVIIPFFVEGEVVVETREVSKFYELTAVPNCDDMTVTYTIRIEYTDGSSKDSVIVAPYLLETNIPTDLFWSRPNFIIPGGSISKTGAVDAGSSSFKGIIFNNINQSYKSVFDDAMDFEFSAKYAKSAVFCLPCVCDPAVLTTFEPKDFKISASVDENNKVVDGKCTTYPVNFELTYKWATCDSKELFDGKIQVCENEKEFDKWINITVKDDCDGTIVVTALATYTDGSKDDKTTTFNVPASAVNPVLVVGSITNPIKRADSNIGQGTVTKSGTATTDKTQTIGSYLKVSRMAQKYTASYNGGFSIGLTAYYGSLKLERDGKTQEVVVNRSWSIKSSTVVGAASVNGLETTYPVDFFFEASFGENCDKSQEGSSVILVTKTEENKFDRYENMTGRLECDGSGYINAVEVWTNGDRKDVNFSWSASDVNLGFTVGNIQNPILRDDTNIGQGSIKNNGSASTNSTKTVQNYLRIAQKNQALTASYNGGLTTGLTSYYPEFSLVRDGKTFVVSVVNKVWTIVPSTTVGNKTTVGNTDKYPVTFNFTGTLNGECETKKSGNSEIHITKEVEKKFDKYTNVTGELFCDGSGYATATEIWTNGDTKEVRFDWTGTDTNVGYSITNIVNPITGRDNTNLGNGSVVNNGSASTTGSRTIDSYLVITRKAQPLKANYTGGSYVTLSSNYAEIALVRDGKTYVVSGANKTWSIASATSIGSKSTSGNVDTYPVEFTFTGLLGGDCENIQSGNSVIVIENEARTPVSVDQAGGNISFFPAANNKMTYAEVIALVYNADKKGVNGGVIFKYKVAGGNWQTIVKNWNEILKPSQFNGDYSLVMVNGEPTPVYYQTRNESETVAVSYSNIAHAKAHEAVNAVHTQDLTQLGFFKGEVGYGSKVSVVDSQYKVTFNYKKTESNKKVTKSGEQFFPLTW